MSNIWLGRPSLSLPPMPPISFGGNEARGRRASPRFRLRINFLGAVAGLPHPCPRHRYYLATVCILPTISFEQITIPELPMAT